MFQVRFHMASAVRVAALASLLLGGRTAMAGPAVNGFCGDGMINGNEDCDTGQLVLDPCCVNCQYTSDPCDDGDACTTGETCSSGKCGGGQAVVCDQATVCHFGVCDAQLGCTYPAVPMGTPCTDHNACTTGDFCTDGICLSGTPVSCDDQDACTLDKCKDFDGTPQCQHAPNPDCRPCGNGHLDPGETCDPPDATIDPATGQAKCRPDCTFCGDGQVQAPESCDDGNRISGCDPRRPSAALDTCQNNCTMPICGDPAVISLRPGPDELTYHGRLVLSDAVDRIDADANAFVFRLVASDASLVFAATLPIGALQQGQRGTIYAFRDVAARAAGNGFAKLLLKRRGDAWAVTFRAFGDLSKSQATMTSEIFVGQKEWTIAGAWNPTPHGWRLDERGTVAH